MLHHVPLPWRNSTEAWLTPVGESVKKILGNKYVVIGVISKVSIIMISCHDYIWLCNPDTEMVATQNIIN